MNYKRLNIFEVDKYYNFTRKLQPSRHFRTHESISISFETLGVIFLNIYKVNHQIIFSANWRSHVIMCNNKNSYLIFKLLKMFIHFHDIRYSSHPSLTLQEHCIPQERLFSPAWNWSVSEKIAGLRMEQPPIPLLFVCIELTIICIGSHPIGRAEKQ